MQAPTLTAKPFKPSFPVTGAENILFRASNYKERGLPPFTYLEAYAGSYDLSEPIPAVAITGTISFDPTTLVVTGAATVFQDELHIGQKIQASNGEILSVAQILSHTSFINGRLPTTTGVGLTAKRAPILGSLGTDRFAMLTGNAEQYDKGTIIAVGSGIFYKNGAVLPGDSLTATRRAQVALYAGATGLYDVHDIGFDTEPNTINTAVTVVAAGGTKNQALGYYSFRLAYYSDITTGYGNAAATLLSGGLTGYQLTVANSTFNFNFAATSAPPAKATGYIVYATAYSGSSAISAVNAIEGPWFELRRIPFTDLSGGTYAGAIAFDYIDSDLSTTVASFDNERPPDAEFVASLAGFVNMVSTNGPGVNTSGRETDTSPGPMVSPMKFDNFDGFPTGSRVPTEKGEIILGVVGAAGRLFLMTPNTLQAATPTGLPVAPFTLRPFWKRGFANPYNLIFVDDTLYGFSGNKMFRSIATGDSASAGHEFAADVEAQMASWSASYVYVAHDPQNEEVCVVSSAIRQNADGYWETDIYPYSLTKYQWQPKITLTDSTRDMVVSGVATVDGHFEFIAGGRREATTDQWDTWRYDTASNLPVPYYVVWSYTDGGAEMIAKVIRKLRPKGKFTDATLSVYAVTPDSVVQIADLETGANPATSVNLDDSTQITQYEVIKRNVKNALMYTCRIDGVSTYDGDPDTVIDTFQELAIDFDIAGQQR